MITIVFVLSVIFNALYWVTKFFANEWSVFYSIHKSFIDVFGIFALLNFLAASALLADTIIRWDEWQAKSQVTLRMTLAAIIAFSFGAQVLLAMMDLFAAGQIM
jgi:hypothetical protein